jgi:hypothetical protein
MLGEVITAGNVAAYNYMLLLGCAAERDATSEACGCGTRLMVLDVVPSWNNISSSAGTKKVNRKTCEPLKDPEAAAWHVKTEQEVAEVIRRSWGNCEPDIQIAL